MKGDGYFNYMGFPPGHYTTEIDGEQLKNVGFEARPGLLSFTVNASKEGDLLSGLKFTLRKKPE